MMQQQIQQQNEWISTLLQAQTNQNHTDQTLHQAPKLCQTDRRSSRYSPRPKRLKTLMQQPLRSATTQLYIQTQTRLIPIHSRQRHSIQAALSIFPLTTIQLFIAMKINSATPA